MSVAIHDLHAIKVDTIDSVILTTCHFTLALTESHFAVSGITYLGKDIKIPPTITKEKPLRMAEFIAGRYCAHVAFNKLQDDRSFVFGLDSRHRPAWPDGIMGSITHTHKRAAAIVAKSSNIQNVGIDLEYFVNRSLSDRVAEMARSCATANHSNLCQCYR